MTISRHILNAFAVLAIAAAALPSHSGDAKAYACKNFPTQSTATRALKHAAQTAAVKNWSASVKSQFDLSWSVWSIAGNKAVNCYRNGARHTCLSSANPCKYVVQ